MECGAFETVLEKSKPALAAPAAARLPKQRNQPRRDADFLATRTHAGKEQK
jgi:hypothetical protein